MPSKKIDKTSPETFVHETIGDGITAPASVGQQMAEADGFIADGFVNKLGPKQGQGVDDVKWGPGNEKFQNHDEQHFDDPSLVGQASFVIRAPQIYEQRRKRLAFLTFPNPSSLCKRSRGGKLTDFPVAIGDQKFGRGLRDLEEFVAGVFRRRRGSNNVNSFRFRTRHFSGFRIGFFFFPARFKTAERRQNLPLSVSVRKRMVNLRFPGGRIFIVRNVLGSVPFSFAFAWNEKKV